MTRPTLIEPMLAEARAHKLLGGQPAEADFIAKAKRTFPGSCEPGSLQPETEPTFSELDRGTT